MAVLSSTSPGQLGKYVIPTVQKLNDAMKRRAAIGRGSGKSYTIKNTPANVASINEFSRIGSQPKTQKQALAITLETTDSKVPTITIGSIDKPNIKYNLGDMSEAVVGAAIAARFIYKNRSITTANVYGVLYGMPPASNYPGKKGKYTEKVFQSVNENKKVTDEVKVYISLAEVNMAAVMDRTNKDLIIPYVRSAVRYANSATVKKWSKLLYENNRADKIDVMSDGLGGQTTTKVDVYVKVNDEKVNINVSLKAGDVKQFGQVSGIEFEKQTKLWETSFGFGNEIKSLESKYNKLIANKDTVPQAVTLVYQEVANLFNQGVKRDDAGMIRKFASSIKYFATLNEDNVTLLQVGNDAAKLYSFDDIYQGIENMQLNATITMGKSGLPTLLINDASGQPLIQYRVKQEFKPDGTPYIRNYVEKQTVLGKLIGENL
jgi:hypothetical protein